METKLTSGKSWKEVDPDSLVNAEVVSGYMGFSVPTVRKQAVAGLIPGYPYKLGSKTHWRFKISEIRNMKPFLVQKMED
jgi:hypothetical protein